jgi:hypothetical protein
MRKQRDIRREKLTDKTAIARATPNADTVPFTKKPEPTET